MLLLGLILFRHARGSAFVLVPAMFVIVCAFWGLFWLLPGWWENGNQLLFALAFVAGVLAMVSMVACLHAFVRSRRQGSVPASTDTP